MRYSRLLTVTLLLLTFAACNRSGSNGELHVQTPAPPTSVDRDTHSQNRINAFFYAALVPRLQSCWARIEGKGEVTFKYTYKRDGAIWKWEALEVEKSTVPREQAAAAQQCMQDAASGTSFPMEAAEAARKGDTFHLHWTWPVPFPSDPKIMAMMISTGPGGGSGECSKTCVDCVCSTAPGPSKCTCMSSCSGYTAPCTVDSDGSGCHMFFPICSTGRIGFAGGAFMARNRMDLP